jgi:DNA (cytosine-5)-methyltransferase 1
VDNTQNIISFCTGYGGIELGLRRAGVDVRTVCNVEIEAFVQANILAKIEEGRMDNAPIYSDLKTFPARIFRGKIHGIIGGYPCQPFSSAGKRKGEKDPRHLWPYIREHVRAIRPVWCFFENVRGHTTMGLWRVLSDLEEDGYRTEWGLFSAEETGAPHQRIRCFILAHTASREPRQSQARNGGQDIGGGSEDTRWPARPGEEQYEWEEPRVVADSRLLGQKKQEQQATGVEQQSDREQDKCKAQSELGGAVDGSACGVDATANRVDRLRLLGNGVVPQTAEIAWKTLWEKLSEQS